MLISLHRLLSAVLAIDAIQMRTKDNPDDPLRRLHGECFEDEVTHLLVSTAAFNGVYRMQRHPGEFRPVILLLNPWTVRVVIFGLIPTIRNHDYHYLSKMHAVRYYTQMLSTSVLP
jgi:hypothetical protein